MNAGIPFHSFSCRSWPSQRAEKRTRGLSGDGPPSRAALRIRPACHVLGGGRGVEPRAGLNPVVDNLDVCLLVARRASRAGRRHVSTVSGVCCRRSMLPDARGGGASGDC